MKGRTTRTLITQPYGSPKFYSSTKSTSWRSAHKLRSAMKMTHVSRLARPDCPIFPFPQSTPYRKPGTAAAVDCTQAQASPSEAHCDGPTLLAGSSPSLVVVEGSPHSGQSGNSRPLASRRVPLVLELALESAKDSRQKASFEARSRADLQDACGESQLGCSAHPRRIANAGLQCFGTYCVPVDETRTARHTTGAALASFSS